MKTFLYITLAVIFVVLEIYLFDYSNVSKVIPWTLFLIAFLVGLYKTGAIQGIFPSNRK